MGSIKPTKTKRGYFGKVESSLNEKLVNVEWGESKVSDLFSVNTSNKRFDANKVKISKDKRGYPYIVRQSTNNGRRGYIQESPEDLNEKNTIAFGQDTATMFYQSEPYFTGDKIKILKPKFKEFNQDNAQFFLTAMEKSFSSFSWGSSSFNVKIIENQIVKIPVKDGKPDFEFMESFIAELEAERIAELEAYLEVTGLSDCDLTEDEKRALDNYDELHFKSFKIEELLDWQKGISEINPLHLDSLTVSDNATYPFYGQSTVNCGVIRHVDLNPKVLNNKNSRPTILIHSNNQNIVFLETPFYLKDGHGATSVLNSDELTKNNALFFMSSIRKVITEKFAYNNKATKIALKSTYVDVPINNLDRVDYSSMELLISAIQKVVIKDVVEYAGTKIEAHKEVIHS